MDVILDRVCGLDVHRDTIKACVRVPGKGRERQATIATFGTKTRDLLAGTARLAGAVAGDPRGDGIDRRVLETRVRDIGRRVSGAAGECGAYQECAGPQDRCQGRGLDRAIAGMRTTSGK